MKAYTNFINEVFTCVSDLFSDETKKLDIFAEGSEQIHSTTQEYAVLKNENADLFCSLITENMELFEIEQSGYQPVCSSIYPSERKISHSCYPKNLRRWMKGTVSRKKACRVEFSVLVWCHIQNWNKPIERNQKKNFITTQEKLLKICNEFSDTKYDVLSLESLWKASCAAYKKSFIQI